LRDRLRPLRGLEPEKQYLPAEGCDTRGRRTNSNDPKRPALEGSDFAKPAQEKDPSQYGGRFRSPRAFPLGTPYRTKEIDGSDEVLLALVIRGQRGRARSYGTKGGLAPGDFARRQLMSPEVSCFRLGAAGSQNPMATGEGFFEDLTEYQLASPVFS